MKQIDRAAAHSTLDALLDAINAPAPNSIEGQAATEERVLELRDELLTSIGVTEIENARMARAAAGLAPGSACEGVPSLEEVASRLVSERTPDARNAVRHALARRAYDERRRVGIGFGELWANALRRGAGGAEPWLFAAETRQGKPSEKGRAEKETLIERVVALGGYAAGYERLRQADILDAMHTDFNDMANSLGLAPIARESVRGWVAGQRGKYRKLFDDMKNEGSRDAAAAKPRRYR